MAVATVASLRHLLEASIAVGGARLRDATLHAAVSPEQERDKQIGALAGLKGVGVLRTPGRPSPGRPWVRIRTEQHLSEVCCQFAGAAQQLLEP